MPKRQRATAIVIQNGCCLLVRDKHSSLWSLPGGTVKRQELPMMSAIRELYEETTLAAYRAWYLGNFETHTTRHHLYQIVAHGDVNVRSRGELNSFQWWNGKDELDTYPHVEQALKLYAEFSKQTFTVED